MAALMFGLVVGGAPVAAQEATFVAISPSTASVAAGAPRTVSVLATMGSGRSLRSWGIDVGYDPAVVTPASCTANPAVATSTCNIQPALAKVTFDGVAPAALLGTITLGTITFRAAGVPGAQTSLPISGPLLGPTFDPFPYGQAPGTLNVVASPLDANGDGQVTAVDALCVLRFLAGLPRTTACPFDP
jgi:hypothetical protein